MSTGGTSNELVHLPKPGLGSPCHVKRIHILEKLQCAVIVCYFTLIMMSIIIFTSRFIEVAFSSEEPTM
jgi:hypothetical protein